MGLGIQIGGRVRICSCDFKDVDIVHRIGTTQMMVITVKKAKKQILMICFTATGFSSNDFAIFRVDNIVLPIIN